MASSQIFSFIFLVLATFLTSTLPFDTNPKDDPNHQLAIVDITNSLPNENNSNPTMKTRCNSGHTNLGDKALNRGDHYRWIVEEKALYYCEALWGNLFASWHAFEPERDVGHESVFWLVKQDGFFLSWDNSTWVKNADWETE